MEEAEPATKKAWWRRLYVQVLTAIACGALLGHFAPELGASLKPLGELFVRLVKMLVAPIIFVTIVGGIAKVGDLRAVGRVGLKAFLYFEVVSTFALVIGLVVANVFQPGAGVHADLATLDTKGIAKYAEGGKAFSIGDVLLHAVPDAVVGAFATGEILQVLFVSILVGITMARLGPKVQPLFDLLAPVERVLFSLIALIMKLAPIGAFGAMAYTIGAFGIESLWSLGKLMACVYATCIVFVVVVLGGITRAIGLHPWRLFRHVGEELLIVLGTSSSEAALPRLIAKLERLGVARSTVGLVVPTGYSFNLDGTSIYLTLAALFVAQATDTHLSLPQQLQILGILLLTSKGAAAVTGGGFITLAATLSTTQVVPVAGIALLLGVDRFMSEARALTNLLGNTVATLAVARWEGTLDLPRARAVLAGAEPDSGPPLEPPPARTLDRG